MISGYCEKLNHVFRPFLRRQVGGQFICWLEFSNKVTVLQLSFTEHTLMVKVLFIMMTVYSLTVLAK